MPPSTLPDVRVSWHAAPAGLQPLVLGVMVWRFLSSRPHRVPVPAHALATLTVVVQGRLHAGACDTAALPAVLSGGPLTEAQDLWAIGPAVMATVLCRASVLPLWTGEPASAFRDAVVPLAAWGVDDDLQRWRDVCPRHALHALHELHDPALAAVLLDHVARRLERAPRRPAAQRFTVALAQWRHELAGAERTGRRAPLQPSDWSERQWQRVCQAELGVSPKLLQRLVRLHRSTCDIGGGGRARTSPLAHVAADAGYADQAHMSREFRELAGCAPASLREASSIEAARMSAELSARLLVPAFFGA